MLRSTGQRMVSIMLGCNSWCSSSTSAVGSSAAAVWHRRVPAQQRCFAGDSDHSQEVNAINEKFAEAREEIEYAREDAETVYFNESAEVARAAVSEVLTRWQGLLDKLPEDEQGKLQRSMGLKIEQLKAELKELDELHA